MARVNTRTARKPYKCGNCHREISPGEEYKWAKPGFRSKTKLIRCSNCSFKPSELDTSKMGQAKQAIEDAEKALDEAATVDDVQGLMDQARDDIQNLADEYHDAAEHFGGGGDNAERADMLEEAVTLLDWQPEGEPNPCDEHDEFDSECDDCQINEADWKDEQIENARSALQEVAL